jgi:DNA polymerase I-like protein with 3'-5' exonuclease and polymerase domains
LGLIPPNGDDKTHPKERALCKVIVLATNYGMGPATLAKKLDITETAAAHLLRKHRDTYARFWTWSDATVDFARLHRRLWTKYGWHVWVTKGSKETTWRNWRVQATGGEVLRVAVCALGAAGFQIDATVHDSVLLEVPAGDAEDAAREAERIMVIASEAVLGEPCRVSRCMVGPGGRLLEAGAPALTWDRIWRLLEGLPNSERFTDLDLCQSGTPNL